MDNLDLATVRERVDRLERDSRLCRRVGIGALVLAVGVIVAVGCSRVASLPGTGQTARYQIATSSQGPTLYRLDTVTGEVRAFVMGARGVDPGTFKNLLFLELARVPTPLSEQAKLTTGAFRRLRQRETAHAL